MKVASTDEVATKIEKIVREIFEVDASDPDFDENVHLFDYGYVDSFGAVRLTSTIESAFDIEVSNSDLVVYPLNTIREIAEFVHGRKSGGL